MSSFEREFNSAIEAVERDVFINLVVENPQLTLSELTRLGKGKLAGLLDSICIGDIVAGARSSSAGGGSGQAHDPIRGHIKARAKLVNTRTPEARRLYDMAVLGVVSAADGAIKAPEITVTVGGTALQVRKSLARLIEAGKISWEGKARGMRYKIT